MMVLEEEEMGYFYEVGWIRDELLFPPFFQQLPLQISYKSIQSNSTNSTNQPTFSQPLWLHHFTQVPPPQMQSQPDRN